MNRVTLAALCFLAIAGTVRAQGESSELEEYIEQIRAWGMTETARMQIHSVSSVCAGATVLSYRKDEASGRYWPSYMSATCPNPDADPPELEQWKSLRMSDSEKLVDLLKPFADADNSGFVTSKEATEFRYLIEFGYLAERVIRDEGASLDLIARAIGMEPADTQERIDAYEAVAAKIVAAGVTELPELSL